MVSGAFQESSRGLRDFIGYQYISEAYEGDLRWYKELAWSKRELQEVSEVHEVISWVFPENSRGSQGKFGESQGHFRGYQVISQRHLKGSQVVSGGTRRFHSRIRGLGRSQWRMMWSQRRFRGSHVKGASGVIQG